eukprot:6392697-Prymnesium_polylepis.1
MVFSSLTEHISSIVWLRHDPNQEVNDLAEEVLAKFEPAVVAEAKRTYLAEPVMVIAQLESGINSVRAAVLEALHNFDSTLLAQHSARIEMHLCHEDDRVRRDAVTALGMLQPADLAQHVGALVQRLDDSDNPFRPSSHYDDDYDHPASTGYVYEAAEKLLLTLEPKLVNDAKQAAMEPCAIVARLQDGSHGVRDAALIALRRLDHALLSQHSDSIVLALNNANRNVRADAVVALGILSSEERTQYANLVIAALQSTDQMSEDYLIDAVFEYMCQLQSTALADHTDALVQGLHDTIPMVRFRSMELLSRLESPVLAMHTNIIVQQLEGADEFMQTVTIDALVKLEPALLVNFASSIAQVVGNLDRGLDLRIKAVK